LSTPPRRNVALRLRRPHLPRRPRRPRRLDQPRGPRDAIGHAALEGQLTAYLIERLRIEDWYRRHPEIAEQQVDVRIFITGLPRTGTTALSHLFAADPDTRSLQMWESSNRRRLPS
jgi:hypothetical protein